MPVSSRSNSKGIKIRITKYNEYLEIGEQFLFGSLSEPGKDVVLEVCECDDDEICKDCYLQDHCLEISEPQPCCGSTVRKDGRSVVFKIV